MDSPFPPIDHGSDKNNANWKETHLGRDPFSTSMNVGGRVGSNIITQIGILSIPLNGFFVLAFVLGLSNPYHQKNTSGGELRYMFFCHSVHVSSEKENTFEQQKNIKKRNRQRNTSKLYSWKKSCTSWGWEFSSLSHYLPGFYIYIYTKDFFHQQYLQIWLIKYSLPDIIMQVLMMEKETWGYPLSIAVSGSLYWWYVIYNHPIGNI